MNDNVTKMKVRKVIEVTTLAPKARHSAIMQAYVDLEPLHAFEIVVDHDPKPLYFQFKFEHKDRFTWNYLEEGPELWRVRIGKTAVPQPEQSP